MKIKISKIQKGIVLLGLSCFLFTSAIAQSEWTLEDCIKYAFDNNIQIKRQELQSDMAKNNYTQSKMDRLPDLNAGTSFNSSYGRSVDRFTNDFTNTNVLSANGSIQSSVVLFAGFQIYNNIQLNKYNVERSLQDYQKAKNDMALQIATVYLQILFAQEALDIATNQLDVTRLQLDKTKKLVEVGNKAKGDLLQIQAQEANEKYNVTNAKNNLNIAYLSLRQLLELQDSTDFKIRRPDSMKIDNANILLSVNEIYNESETKLPQVKSAEYQLKSYEKGLNAAYGQLSPTLSLSGSYYTGFSDARKQVISSTTSDQVIGYVEGTNASVYTPITQYQEGNYPFFDQLRDNNNKSISLNLNIPIFNKFQTRTNISNARIRVNDAKFNVAQVKKDLYQEIEKAHADAVAAYERFKSAQEAVTSNEESFKYVQQKYEVGMVSSVDFNIAKNDLIKAQSDLIQAKYEYIFKLKVLDFYRGNILTI